MTDLQPGDVSLGLIQFRRMSAMNTKALIAAAVVVALAGGGYAALRYSGVFAPGDPIGPGASPVPSAPDDKALAAAQVYCPIMPETKLGEMGEPVKIMVKDKSGVEQPVFVCCKGCKRKVLADPDRMLAKVAELKAASIPK